MATEPVSQNNFTNACTDQGVNPLSDKKQQAKEAAAFKFVAYKEIYQAELDRKANYRPLFHQLKNEYPLKRYGNGYRCVNREID